MSRFDTTSWSLVLSAAAADATSQDRFCDRYASPIRDYLASRWRLPADHERVADATQEVFVRLLRPSGPLERARPGQPGGFRAYLTGIVRNVALESDRAARRRSHLADIEPEELPSDLESASRVCDRVWAAIVVEEAWSVLRKGTQGKPRAELRTAVLELRFGEGLGYKAIAERLGTVDERQAYRLVVAGRRHFRKALIDVLTRYQAGSSSAELEERCKEVIELL